MEKISVSELMKTVSLKHHTWPYQVDKHQLSITSLFTNETSQKEHQKVD